MHKISGVLITFFLGTLLLAACAESLSEKNMVSQNSSVWDIQDDKAFLAEMGFSESNTASFLTMKCSKYWHFSFATMRGQPPRKMSATVDGTKPLELLDFGVFETKESILDAKLPILLSESKTLSVDYVVEGEYFTAEFDISDIETGFAKLKPNCEYAEN